MRWFFVLALAALLTASIVRRAETVDRSVSVPSRVTWSLAPGEGKALHVRTMVGNIAVVPGKQDQMEFVATRRVRSAVRAEAKAFLHRMIVERRMVGETWTIEARWPTRLPADVESAAVDLEIRVPPGTVLVADTGVGNVDARGSGPTRLHTGVGQVNAREVGGALDASTGAGDMKADGCAGRVEAQVGSGGIRVLRAVAAVKATTGAGDIEVAASPTNDAAVVDMQTGVGNLTLRLPKNSSTRVEASTGVGTVEGWPGGIGRLNEGRTHLKAVLGAGKSSAQLHTGVGDIRLLLTPGG